MSSESDSQSVLSDDGEEDQKKRFVEKELHRIDNLKKEQDEFMCKLSCEKPLRMPSMSRQEITQNVNEDRLSQLLQEVEEEMDELIAKAKQYVQFLYKTQGEENSSLPNTYLKVQPSILKKGKLTYYQLQGLNWLISLQEAGLNGILADQMGLGKTIQTIALIGFMSQFKNISGPHLIVGPLSTVPNWIREFKEWLPNCRVIKMLATEVWREEHGKLLNQNNFDVIVTSYESILNNDRILKKFRYQYLIIDEAHKLKNEESQFVCQVKKLNSRFKLLLTGTPIQNNPHELWSLLNYLMPQLFTSSEIFDQWFQINKIISEKELLQEKFEKKNFIITEKAKSIISAFMLRRTKNEVALEIPPKKEIHLYVQMTPKQKAHYKSLILNKKIVGQCTEKSIQNLLMQLRKLCQHLYMFPELEDPDLPALGEHLIEGSGKFKVLDLFLKKLFNEKHKVILFSQFTTLLNILEDYLNFREYKYCRIDGNTQIEERDENIKNFQNPKSDIFIFLLSTRAGGLGITLTAADTVIIYDSDFNPQLDQQAMDRAHRIGQTKQVMVYRLICRSTVEEKIIERQQIKLRWEQMVIDGGHAQIAGLMNSKEDLKSLTAFGASQILKDEPYTEEDIETLLKRGEELTEQLNKEIDKKFKVVKEIADKVDLGVKTIKVLDFFKDPNNREDLQTIEQELQLQSNLKQPEQLSSRKQVVLPRFSNLIKEVIIDPHKFYSDPEQLKQLLQREKDVDLSEELKRKDIEFVLDKELMGLTSMEKKQLVKLQQSGFDWSTKQFSNFIQACIKFGRKDIVNIADSLSLPEKEVKNYIAVFNDRHSEILGYQKFMERITKAEAQLEQEREFTKLLDEYMKWFQDPLLEMDFSQSYRNSPFTFECDQLLIYATYKIGFGKWDKIKELILNHEMSFFDDFIRTMSTKTLKARVLLLMKQVKKFVQSKLKKSIKKTQTEEKKEEEPKQEGEEEKQKEQKKKSKSRSASRSKKKKSKSVKKQSMKQKTKSTKSPKPISSIKSHSLDQALKKQVLKK